MPTLNFKFYPAARLPKTIEASIRALITDHPTAPTPETPNNSLIFIPLLDKHAIGYATVTIHRTSAHITSLFIQPEHQRQHIGKKLIMDILSKISKTGCQRITITCPNYLLSFFQSLGFIISKEIERPQEEKHFELENPCPGFYLDVLQNTLQNQGVTLESLKTSHQILGLSQDQQHYQYSQQKQFINFHRNMLLQAQKQIWLISDNITSPLLNDEVVRDSLLRLSKRNARAEIRILLEDDKKGAGYYNPTIELAQKLTSFIEIRTIPKGAKKPGEMITAVDFNAGIFRKDMTNYVGFAHYNNHLIAQRLRDKYEQHWQFATPSMQLRRLSL